MTAPGVYTAADGSPGRRTDRQFNRVTAALTPLQRERVLRFHRRLCQKPRLRSAVHLRRMNQKRMADVHGPRVSRGGDFRPARRLFEAIRQFHEGHPPFPRGREEARHIPMGSRSYPCRSVEFAHVGKEKQQQQRAAF